MEETLSRLHQSIDYLKHIGKIHKQQDIADAMGMGKARVSEALKGKEGKFTEHFLDRFAETFSDIINKEWLLTGEGRMTKTIRFDIPHKAAKQYADLMHAIIEQKELYRPHVEAKASAGVIVGISKGEYVGEMREVVQGVPDYDFTIKTEGESMLPRIEDGDDLCCRISDDRLNPPIGKICVVSTKDGNAVKVIQDATEDTVTLHSLNPRYKDYTVDINDIIQIAQVVGLVRSFV